MRSRTIVQPIPVQPERKRDLPGSGKDGCGKRARIQDPIFIQQCDNIHILCRPKHDTLNGKRSASTDDQAFPGSFISQELA
jgi:hypothetical protein